MLQQIKFTIIKALHGQMIILSNNNSLTKYNIIQLPIIIIYKQQKKVKIKMSSSSSKHQKQKQKQSQSKYKSKHSTPTNSSSNNNRSGLSQSTPYQQIKYQMERLFQLNANHHHAHHHHNNNRGDSKKDNKDSARTRNKISSSNNNNGNNNSQSTQIPKNSSNMNQNNSNIIKCFMHQPIVNNFINISQQQPMVPIIPMPMGPAVKIKTSLKQQKQKLINNNKIGSSITTKYQVIQKKWFNYKYIIGKGGFGKVWKVQHRKTRNLYAMKQMLKSIVLTKKSVQSIINQQKLLSSLNSPFLVNMHYAFQDRQTLYLVLDLMQGGDLRHHLSCKIFTEIQSKFFISCIILGLDHLHSNSIIHRDIKPQNLVMDNRGYIRITDLGIARLYRSQNSSDTSGTPGYMSPEVICRQNHGYVSDLFAVGVIAYQLMLGKRPYNGMSRQEIRQAILAKQANIKPYQVPQGWSMQSMDFVNKLLQRRPEQRLGSKGIQQVKDHPWLQSLNWKSLLKKQIQSPFIPLMKKSDFDQDQKITVQDQEQAELIQKNSLLLRKAQFQQLFKQYYFDEQQQQQQQSASLLLQSQPQSIHSSYTTPLNLQLNEQIKSKRGYLQSAKSSSTRQKSFTKQSPISANYGNININNNNNNVIASMTHSLPFNRIINNNSNNNTGGNSGNDRNAGNYRDTGLYFQRDYHKL